MKRFSFLFLLLSIVPTGSSAQDSTYLLRIEYRMQLNYSEPTEYSSFLLINATSGYFAYRAVLDSAIVSGGSGFRFADTSEAYVYTNRKKGELVSLGKTLKGKSFNIIEGIPEIEWNITKEQKIISGYTCFEAQGEFRGRNYKAWFAPEISISLGPWKLNGLPGLILEVYDDTYEVMFTAVSIKSDDSNLRPDTSFPKVSRSEYKKLLKQSVDDFRKMIASKAGRGVRIVTKSSLSGLELD